MNEQLQAKLVEVISQIQQAVHQSSSFVLEQLPDIAQQYVLWGRISNTVICSVLLLVATIFFVLCYKAWAKPWREDSYSKKNVVAESCWAVRLFSGFAGSLFLAGFIDKLDLMVWFAPKVWLLKELAALIK